MPLFSRSSPPPPAPTSTTTSHTTADSLARRKSFFSRRQSTSPAASPTAETKHHPHILRKDGEDASIAGARERVLRAEAAEREADRALLAAREAVKVARRDVERLEREAAEE